MQGIFRSPGRPCWVLAVKEYAKFLWRAGLPPPPGSEGGGEEARAQRRPSARADLVWHTHQVLMFPQRTAASAAASRALLSTTCRSDWVGLDYKSKVYSLVCYVYEHLAPETGENDQENRTKRENHWIGLI